MTRTILVLVSSVFFFASVSPALEAKPKGDSGAEIVKATYVVTGLHCPPCTKTVESSLKGVKGIRSIIVDWKTKSATVEFDESSLSAQRVAQQIADTPHMMGRKMHYGGLLVLHVSSVKDKASAQPAEEALKNIKGVERVLSFPAQHAVEVQFASKGDTTTTELIDVLKKAGISAST